MSMQILNDLKAEEVLKGTTILGQTLNLKATLKYKTDGNSYSFEDYFHILNAEIQGIERIELSAAITPGGAQSYLTELSTALQLVTDKVESAHTKAIYFEGKLKSAAHLRDNLQSTFSAWYLIAMSEKLKMYDIKLPVSTQKALAESEFARLVGEEDLNIDGLISAVEVMVIHLKDMKKIAYEKYKLGADQANAAITNLPFNGIAEGDNKFSLLKQRWDVKTSAPSTTEEEWDDVPVSQEGKAMDALIQEEEDDPTYIKRSHRENVEIPEGIHKIISASVVESDEDEVSAEDLVSKAKAWHQKVVDTAEEAYKKAEEFDDLPEMPLALPATDLPSLEEVKKAIIIEDSFAGTIKVQDSKAELVPLRKRVINFEDEDADLEIIAPPKPPKKAVMDDEEEFIKPVKKKTVSFDDEDADFSTPLPPPLPKSTSKPKPAKSKQISFDDEDLDTPF